MRIESLFNPLFLLLFGTQVLAAADNKAPLKKALARYQRAQAVQAQIEKTVEMPTLNEKKTAPGQLYFSKGRFRLEMKDEEKTTIVLDGKTLWVATLAPEDLGGKWQVMKSTAPSLKKASSLLAMLFGDNRILDQMDVVSVKESDGLQVYKLIPKKSAGLEIKDLEISFKGKPSVLEAVKYGDELGNQTLYVFKSSDLKSPVNQNKFKYAPPKDAEVTKF